tara:strand:+ start:2627 stop:3043 length:417 start_codon:yes stop_codon:yes gene_type:complete
VVELGRCHVTPPLLHVKNGSIISAMRSISLFLSFCLFLATAFPAAAMQDCAAPAIPDCENTHHVVVGDDLTVQMSMDDMKEGPASADCTDMPGCTLGSAAVHVSVFPTLQRQLNTNPGLLAVDHESPHLFPPVEPPIR